MNEMSILALAKICGEAGKNHATVEMIKKCLDNDVPNEYLKLLLTNSDTEELKAYRDTGLTPEKIREVDREYQRKCSLVKSLVDVNNKLRDRIEKNMSGEIKEKKYGLRDLLFSMNVKEQRQVRQIISDAIKKGMSVGCIGTAGTGKATLLKQILAENEIVKDVPICINDGYQDVVNEDGYRKAASGESKYFVTYAHNAKEFLNKLLANCPDPQVGSFLIITCARTNGDRVLPSIDEIRRTLDGEYEIINVFTNDFAQELQALPQIRAFRELIDNAKELSELFPSEGHEYIEALVKWFIIGRRNMIFSGKQNVGKTSVMHSCAKDIPKTFRLRHFDGRENHIDFLDNRTDTVIAIEEIATNLSALQYVQATNKLTSVLATHHAPTMEGLVMAFRNSLLSTNLFPDEKSAERAAVKAINIDFHMERSQANEKFVERITEIIPTDDPADSKLYTAKNLIEYRDGKYIMVAMPSDKILDDIRMMLSDSDKEAFEKDMKMFRNAISVTEETVTEDTCTAKETNAEEVAEADNTVAENIEETAVESASADVETAKETAEDDKSKGGKKRKLDIGKIMALKNAGWKIKDIAYELHTSPAVISNAIWKHTKKEIKETK